MKRLRYKINRLSKLYVIYFPVILIAGQVLVNLSSFVVPHWYIKSAFYLNLSFGTNILISLMLLRYVFMFRMCSVSRACAWAEVAFAVNYAIVKEDNLYNIMFQVIVGAGALVYTFWYYKKRFPLCRFSLLTNFYANVIRTGNCQKGYDRWQRHTESLVLKEKVKKWTVH